MDPKIVKNYVNNSSLLKLIDESKVSYCAVREDLISREDCSNVVLTVENINKVKKEDLLAAIEAYNNSKKKDKKELTIKNTVVQVQTEDHLPEDYREGGKLHRELKLKSFKRYLFTGKPRWTEVCRSHWEFRVNNKKNFECGKFALKGKISDPLVLALIAISKNYCQKKNLRGYTFNEDMVQEASMHLTRIILSFDETKSSNPFAYASQAVLNVCRGMLKAEAKQRDIKDKMYIENGLKPSAGYEDRLKMTEEERKINFEKNNQKRGKSVNSDY